MPEIYSAILTGVISGIIASVFFMLILLKIKPKVSISQEICISRTKEGKEVHQIKVVNNTRAMLVNVKYSLHYCEVYGDGIVTIHHIEALKSPITTITKYDKKDKLSKYAVRLSYDLDEEKYPLDENHKLLFTFLADHAVSNTTKSMEVEYYAKDVKRGVFESGTSTKVMFHQH